MLNLHRLHKINLKTLSSKKYQKFLPQVYLRLLLFSLAVTGLFVFYPAISVCPFGPNNCMPIGVLIIFAISFPGYFIISALTTRVQLPEFVMLLVLILFSLAFYFVLGYLIDSQKGKKPTVSTLVKFIVFIAFLVLIFLLLMFL